MTRQTFYRNLAKLSKKGEWGVYNDGWHHTQSSLIRAGGVIGECPIAFVANKKAGVIKFDSADAWRAAEYIGLDKKDAAVIIGSADRNLHGSKMVSMGQTKFNSQCRDALLRATGANFVENQ